MVDISDGVIWSDTDKNEYSWPGKLPKQKKDTREKEMAEDH